MEMEKHSELRSETLLYFVATRSERGEKKNGSTFLAGNFQAASNKEMFEEMQNHNGLQNLFSALL